MRKCTVFLSVVMIALSMPMMGFSALTVVSMGDNAISAKPYVTPIQKPNAYQFEQYLKLHPNLNARFSERLKHSVTPSRCVLTEGLVTSHFIQSIKSIPTFFVMNNSQSSLIWLKQNSAVFSKEKAKGFLVNGSLQQAQALSHQYGLPILPVSCNGLSAVVKTTHVPFFVKSGWVTQ